MEKKIHYLGVEREALRAYFQVLELGDLDLPLPEDVKISEPESRTSLSETAYEVHSNVIFYFQKSKLLVRAHLHGVCDLEGKRVRYKNWRVQYIKIYSDPKMEKLTAAYMVWYSPKDKLRICPVSTEDLPLDPDGLIPRRKLLERLKRFIS